MITPVEATLLIFVVVSALATALFRDVLSAIIVFAAYSLGMAIIYTFLLAPDVALTEAAIGAGVTTILLLVTIAKTVRPSTDALFESIDAPAAIAVGAFALVLGAAALPEMPAIGAQSSPIWSNPEVTQYYLENTYADTGVKNAVTAVLAAYRGFDTFGEAVVIFGAAVAVLLVLDREGFA